MSPNQIATLLILLSALLHAAANMLIKVSGDALTTRGCMNAFACLVALPFLPWVPLPGADLWPLLAASVAVHALYPFLLVQAYRAGDLSLVFPLARGAAPVFIAVFAYLALHEPLRPAAAGGVTLVSLAIASLAYAGSLRRHAGQSRGIGFAFATALTIAVYTVIDAAGLRRASTPWSYIVWLFVLDGAIVALLVYVRRRGVVRTFLATEWRSTLAAAALGVLTYGLALLALSMGAVAEIGALRETSIIFAAFIGAYVLREPLGRPRVCAALVVAAGIILMQLR